MKNIDHFQKELEQERTDLGKKLKGIGRINPDDPSDWQPTPDTVGDIATDPDRNVQADAVEEYEERAGVETVLEDRYNQVKEALKRIEDGKYGVCEKCGKEIEEDRLAANPTATTCKSDMNS